MSQKRNRYLKIRVSGAEYNDIMARASDDGLNLSEYVRVVLAMEHQAATVDALLKKIDERLPAESQTLSPAMNLEPLLVETLLLVRELVAERQAQSLGRTAKRLDDLFPGRIRI